MLTDSPPPTIVDPLVRTPESIHTSGAVSAGVVVVIDNPIYDGAVMLADTSDERPTRQLRGGQVDGATRTDPHCWGPLPSQLLFKVALHGDNGRAIPYRRTLAPFTGLLFLSMFLQSVVDQLIRLFSGYRYRPRTAVSSRAFVARTGPSTIVVDPLHSDFPFTRVPSNSSIPCQIGFLR